MPPKNARREAAPKPASEEPSSRPAVWEAVRNVPAMPVGDIASVSFKRTGDFFRDYATASELLGVLANPGVVQCVRQYEQELVNAQAAAAALGAGKAEVSGSGFSELVVRDLVLDVGTAAALSLVLPGSTLRSLRFHHAALGASALELLLRGLRADKCAVQSLSLDWNPLGDVDADAQSCVLAEFVACTRVQLLSLRGNGIGERGGSAIGRALQQNCTLLELDLHGNPLGDTGSHALAAALVENTQLRALGLSRTGTTDVGAKHLLAALTERHLSAEEVAALGLPCAPAELDALCAETAKAAKASKVKRPSALEFAIPSRTVGVLRGFVHTGRRWVAPGNRTLQMLDLSHNPLGAQGVLALLGGLAEFQQSLGRAREQAAEAEAFEQENARALEAARKAAAPRSPRTGAQQQQQPRRQQDLSGLPEAERALLTRAALLRQRCDDAVAEAAGRAPIVLSLLQLQSVAPLPVTLHDGSFVALAQRALPHAAQARSAATAPDATAAASAAAAISALAQEAADAETPPLLSLPPDTEAPGVEAGRSSGRSAANSRRASVGRAPLRPDAFALAASALNSCTRRRLPEDHYAALPTGWPVREGTEGSPLTIPVSEDTLRMCALAQQLARDFAITVEP